MLRLLVSLGSRKTKEGENSNAALDIVGDGIGRKIMWISYRGSLVEKLWTKMLLLVRRRLMMYKIENLRQ
jgi:hypothetical protein